MTAAHTLSQPERMELAHLAVVTREGQWTHRQYNLTALRRLVDLGYVEKGAGEAGRYRVTDAGQAAYRAMEGK